MIDLVPMSRAVVSFAIRAFTVKSLIEGSPYCRRRIFGLGRLRSLWRLVDKWCLRARQMEFSSGFAQLIRPFQAVRFKRCRRRRPVYANQGLGVLRLAAVVLFWGLLPVPLPLALMRSSGGELKARIRSVMSLSFVSSSGGRPSSSPRRMSSEC